MQDVPHIKRRSFLAVSAGMAGQRTTPAPKRPAPSRRLAIGLIGVGVRGRDHHLRKLLAHPRVEIAAICDVDRLHAAMAARMVRQHGARPPMTVTDFRRVLDRPDIDAVVISTPDHWHSIITIQAIEAGKDVYCEKPLTLFIEEGRRMVETARQYGAVVQVGSQQRSDWRFRQAVRLVRENRLGQLRRITTHLGMPGTTRGAFLHPGEWEPAETPPPQIDWNLWLGPAPYHDYSPNRCHFEFRYHLDHSGGRITDWGAHHNDIAQWALGMDNSGPVHIEGKGAFNKVGPYDYAGLMEVRYRYANGVELLCENEGGNGVRFHGANGWIYVSRMTIEASDPAILEGLGKDEQSRDYDERNRREEIPGTDDHHNNWLDAIESRGVCAADIETGHRSATLCHLGNIAMRLGRPLQWNPEKEEFTGDPAANVLKGKPLRAPWRL